MSSLSAASILLHAFLLTPLLAAATVVSATATSIPAEHGDVNTTMTTFTNRQQLGDDDVSFEMYFCFLCSGRDPLLIHHCPIYWDECHLICDDDMSSNTVVPAIPTATTDAPPAPMVQGDDCYVMKLYMSGRYVIVEHRPCKYIAWCFLTCGGGELMADRRRKAVVMGTATTALSAAIQQGSFLPAVDLCGTQQVNAPWAPPSPGVVVPDGDGGGAHRRR